MCCFNDYEIRGDVAVIFAFYKGEKFEVLVDLPDLDRLKRHGRRWRVAKRSYTNYVKGRGCECKDVYLHQFILGITGRKPVADHLNHNGLDNRRRNLRITTQETNGLNRSGPRKGNMSGLRGVSWSSQKNKWQARVTHRRRSKHLGFFEDKHEAAKAVQAYLASFMEVNLAS